MDSCPKELKAYDKARKLQIEEQDILMHAWFGNYAASAFYVAIDHSFNQKAKSEYIKEPIYKAFFEDEKLTEEEIEEREMQKALWIEEQWIKAGQRKGLPETVF